MKKAVILILFLGCAAAVVWRFYPELLWPLVEHTPLKERLSASTPVYQWRDADGNWQVTDEPPAEGVPYEVRQYKLDANVLPPFREEDN
jgi:hypothetical protein